MPPLNPFEVDTVQIGKPLYGGAFETTEQGTVTGFLAGERVELKTGQILEESADRVVPRCVHFGVCGGCQYQQVRYTAQLAIKTQILRELLSEAGLQDLPEIGVHAAAEWEYRNRIRLRVRREAAGIEIGYSRRGSNEFLAIRMCPIAAPLLWRAAETMQRLAGEDAAWGRWMAGVAEAELFCTADESRFQVRFLMLDAEPARSEPGLLALVCEHLRAQMPELAGAGAELEPEVNRRVRRRWAGAAWGAAGLNYQAAGRSYWVSRGAFFQVNRGLVDRLVELVCRDLSGEVAWDLFAGVGLFTRPLAERFRHVVAVEAGDAAAADLQRASQVGSGGAAFEAVHTATLEFLRGRLLQRERPELIVLDPPRAGLGAESAKLLARMAAPRVVYVSCDPVTLARDLAILTRDAYRVASINLIDLFPQTFHLETVVHLVRTSAAIR